MGGGFILGVFWGLLVSGVVLAAVSLSLPLPPRPDAAPPVAETAVFAPSAQPEVEATPPAEDVVEETEAAEAPAVEDAADAPVTETASTGPAQSVPLPAGSEFNRQPPEEPTSLPETEAPVTLTQPETPTLETVTEQPAPEPDADPAPVPDVALAPAAPTAPVTPEDVEPEAPPTSRSLQNEGEDEAAEDTLATASTAPGGASSPRLPQVTAPADPAVSEETSETAPRPSDDDKDEEGALAEFAVSFEAEPDQPLLAVILFDDPTSVLTAETLTRFSFPVAFAIDPTRPDAAERAEFFHEAGFEVVIAGDIFPEGATETDVAQAIEGAASVLRTAIALIDTPGGRIQGDRPILDATVDTLAITGHGLVAFPQGLNAAEQTARRAEVPAGTLFRELDDEGQRATVITRFLTRAAFAAGENGTVIVAGSTRPDTVTALFSWALGARTGAVTIAPLSAVLLREAE